MAEPLLTDIFGAGATQTATTITIDKADLLMTANASNKGEQIFAAVAKKAADYLTATRFSSNIDQSVSIATGYDQLVYRTVSGAAVGYLQSQLVINFAKITASTGITPDDY